MKKKKITLALSGGGVKGYAHIGVIEALEEHGFEIAGISGTSAGGVFGSFYAYGYSIPEIKTFIDEIDKSKLFQRNTHDNPSLIGLKGLYQMLDQKFGEDTIDKMHIPFATTAVDINTNKELFIDCGRIKDAVKATSAMPGIFPFQDILGFKLIDGGVFDPVPVELARWIAGNYPVVAVSLFPKKENAAHISKLQIPAITPIPSNVVNYLANLRLGKALDVFITSLDIMQIVMADMQLNLTKPDVVLYPDTSKYFYIDDVEPEYLIENGRSAVEDSVYEIKRAVRKFRPQYAEKPCQLLSEVFHSKD